VTQRQFVNAYQRGEVDSDELATALRRYDESDTNGKQFADEVIEQTGQNGPRLIAADVCNSPCQGTIKSVYDDYKDGDLSKKDAKKLLRAYDEAEEVTTGPGKDGAAAVEERVNNLENQGIKSTQEQSALSPVIR